MIQELIVELGERRYPIRIGAGQLQDASVVAALVPGRHALIVTDAHVAPLYLSWLSNALTDKNTRTIVLPPGEKEKNLVRFSELMDALVDLGASRDVTLLALGGGVIGDLTGFAAACWMRGVRFVQLPTTLLAMVDASVGGKTAVDLPSGKNLVGAFHQPAAVIIDPDTLKTLPDREFRAGLAEVVKIAAITDAEFFAWLETNAEALLKRDTRALVHAITVSCTHKAGIVSRDETEQGERLLLNFGHSFGHAIETEQGYSGLLHGEAVAVGMMLAARLSQQLGRASFHDTARLGDLLTRLALPVTVPAGLMPASLLGHMRLDKKSLSGVMRLIVWHGIGKAEVVQDISDGQIAAVWA